MKVILNRDNRTFEAYVNMNYGSMVEISFYEVIRPTWKIFRTKFFPFYSTWFCAEDYNSIMDGVETCLTEGFHEEALEQSIENKWKEFEKTIDKSSKV